MYEHIQNEVYWKHKNDTKSKYKVGDIVKYLGKKYKILRIDRHVHPICIGGGIRLTDDILDKENKC